MPNRDYDFTAEFETTDKTFDVELTQNDSEFTAAFSDFSVIVEKYDGESTEDIDVAVDNQRLTISATLTDERRMQIDNAVPQHLSIFGKLPNSNFSNRSLREKGQVFIRSNDSSYYTTLQDIKGMGTKIVLTDGEYNINELDVGDYIYIKNDGGNNG